MGTLERAGLAWVLIQQTNRQKHVDPECHQKPTCWRLRLLDHSSAIWKWRNLYEVGPDGRKLVHRGYVIKQSIRTPPSWLYLSPNCCEVSSPSTMCPPLWCTAWLQTPNQGGPWTTHWSHQNWSKTEAFLLRSQMSWCLVKTTESWIHTPSGNTIVD